MSKYDGMSIQELEHEMGLVTAALKTKKDARIAELKAELDKLTGGGKAPRVRGEEGTKDGRSSPKPKYRSLKNPTDTWSGKGQQAGWLTKEMAESGKPLEAFLIKD